MAIIVGQTNPATGQPYTQADVQAEQQQQQQQAAQQQTQAQLEAWRKAAQDAQAAAIGGPALTANPMTRTVTMPDGTTKVVDDSYALQNGETDAFGLRKEFQSKRGEQYAQPLLAQQLLEEQTGRDSAAQQAARAAAEARSSAAMRGGIKSGSNDLMQRNTLRESLLAQQGVSRQGIDQRAKINAGVQDINQKADTTDTSNLFSTVSGVNQFNLEKYKQQKAVEASKNQADATRASGGK